MISKFYKDSSIFMGNTEDMKNKLFCSFTLNNNLPETLAGITSKYTILYNKIFILESIDTEELLITYNVDTEKPLTEIPDNTILLHRKKDSNTLYTINALNIIIKSLNGGVLDKSYQLNWLDYKNTVLLTQDDELRKIRTKIYKIINL